MPEITLLNIDCMQYMATQPDNAFDLAIVDPPYGIGVDGQKESKRGFKSDRKHHEKKFWDAEIPPQKYFSEINRVAVNIIVWGGNYFLSALNEAHKGWIVWDKGQRGLTMSDCELAYSSFDKPTRVWTQNRVILLKEGTIHPTQKPVRLYQWILDNYAKPGQRILDTHLGSGSSAIAAHYFGCDFVGCEIDEGYYQAAVKRFDMETRQESFL